MLYDASTWYLSVVPAAVATGVGLAGGMRLEGVRSSIGGAIRTRSDLEAVRRAIELNMALALAYIGLWIASIAVLLWAVKSGLTPIPGAAGHFLVLGLLTLPCGLWNKAVEKRFRAMPVEGSDPSLAATFARWLEEWKKRPLGLSDPDARPGAGA
ncbi:MAG: hypothetical protein AB1347_11210 [Acidobacteriota bacterium]